MFLKRLINPIVVLIAFTAVLAVGGAFLINHLSRPKPPQEQALLGDFIPEEGRDHIPTGTKHMAYSSNPPTSGPHYVQPAAAGIYDRELPNEQLIHNLEHGHVWISYKTSSASAELIENLKTVVKENSRLVILTPREANDSLIALASWTRLLKLDHFDKQVIVDFIKTNRGHAPEFIP